MTMSQFKVIHYQCFVGRGADWRTGSGLSFARIALSIRIRGERGYLSSRMIRSGLVRITGWLGSEVASRLTG